MPNYHFGTESERQALDAYVKLMRAAGTLAAKINRQLSQAGLTEGQFGVLEVLYHRGALHQCQIAAKLLTSGANMTTVLDNLEKRELISREKDPQDRRSTIISLTDTGTVLIHELFPRHAEFIAEQMTALDPQEQALLGELCRKLGHSAAEKTNGTLSHI